MNIRYFPCRNKKPLIEGWQQQATSDPNQLAAWQREFPTMTHWGIATGKEAGIIALDVDTKTVNGFETLKAAGHVLPDTPVQYTLSGGAHIFFKYPDDGEHYGNTVGSKKDGLDTRGQGGYVILYGNGPDWTKPLAPAPDWLKARSHRVRLLEAAEPTFKIQAEIGQATLLDAMEAIRNAPEGQSNDVLNRESFRIGQIVAGQGLERAFAEAQLFAAAIERGKPAKEAIATITSGLNGGVSHPLTTPFSADPPHFVPAVEAHIVANAPQRWTPRRLTRQDLVNTLKLRKPQLHRDWSTEDIHITTADGGTGKTTLKLYEAVCLALGDSFLGFQCVQPGRTLYITGEDTAEKLAAMIGQILRQMGLLEPGNDAKVQQVLESIVIKKDADLCLIAKDRQGFLQPNGMAFQKVMEAIEDIRPKLIVFDPIASFWGSEAALNDMNKAVTKFMSELVERSEACVEMINHMGKSSSQAKDMSQFAGRGGTGLPSNSRVSRVLRALDETEFQELTGFSLEQGKSAMLCQVNKFSDGSPLLMKPFVILRDRYLFSRISLIESKAREAETNIDDTERIMEFVKRERASKKFPTREVLEAHFVNAGVPMKLTKIRRAVDLLHYQGLGGLKFSSIENPDVSIGGKAIIITDMEGREI